jgi:hypothetical protein
MPNLPFGNLPADAPDSKNTKMSLAYELEPSNVSGKSNKAAGLGSVFCVENPV